MAYAIDLAVVTALLFLASLVIGLCARVVLTTYGTPLSLDPDSAALRWTEAPSPMLLVWLGILLLVFAFVLIGIYHGYFIWFEHHRQGQTPGKRWLGLRVVDAATGGPITYKQALNRDLMRYIDVGLLIPGIVAILLDREQARRLGDRVARTRVILASVKEPSGAR